MIEDVVDVPPEVAKTSYASLPGPIKVVWFGHQGYECFIVGWAEKLREELGDSFSFEVISTGAFATRQWSEQTIVDDLLDCDIAVLPIPVGEWFANKSSNRLAMLFSLAMPTVASPIHSYREIGVHGVNVLFADPDGFGAALRTLIDPAYREKLGAQARRTVGQRFSVDAIAPQWLDRLQAIERVPRRNLKASAFAAVLKLAGAWSAPPTSR